MADKQKVLAGRKAVDAYREAHTLLHQKPYYRKVHADHTPLLNKMVDALGRQGFSSVQEFFDANRAFIEAELARYYIREGECNHCGKCCEGCQHYLGNGECGIYETRPQTCKGYPTIRNLLEDGVPSECSYSLRQLNKPDIDLVWR